MLLVANYASDVGYAWWLMEGFWASIAHTFMDQFNVLLAFPAITHVPETIGAAPLHLLEHDMSQRSIAGLPGRLRLLRRHHIQAIYFTDRSVLSWEYILYRLLGVRTIIVHDHTPGARSRPTGVRRLLKQLLHRLPYINVDALIGVSGYVHQRHREVVCFPERKCFLAENGLPDRPPAVPLDVHARFGIPRGRKILVSTGRAHPVKGVHTVIEAMKILVHQEKRTDLHYLHCGDGPLLSALQQLVEAHGLDDFVTLAGRQQEISAILRGCDLAIHASYAEVGYSLAILEFMEAGLPVIVSDHPSVCGATEPGISGVLMKTGDSESAASAIGRLLDDPSHASALGQAAAVRVRERFSLSSTHHQLLAALDTVLVQTRR